MKSNLFISPTDTVIGIGGPVSEETKDQIYKIKKRPKNKKLVIMVSSLEEAKKYEGWNSTATKLANEFWPGALTIALTDELSLRMPDHEELLELIKKIGPIYMTSANISGQNVVSSLEEAKTVFPNIKIYEFKIKKESLPSTIVDTKLNIIRQGSIKIK
ncbi:MAG: Sua5/YciO/YrdC/YwlC family protein [Mycoplasma sp.]|nr:Sua5/YciO/YrdC/YwlC family protein [Mycoplasma sp.]